MYPQGTEEDGLEIAFGGSLSFKRFEVNVAEKISVARPRKKISWLLLQVTNFVRIVSCRGLKDSRCPADEKYLVTVSALSEAATEKLVVFTEQYVKL